MKRNIYSKSLFFLGILAFLCGMLAEAVHAKPKRFYTNHRIVMYGGSITAGYGIEFEEDYFTKHLQDWLNVEFLARRIEVVNAGRVGDTSVSALPRLPSILAMEPDIVVIELGQNDAVQGFDPDMTYNALDQILSVLTHNNIYVLLLGYEAPKNWPTPKQVRYNRAFIDLADRYKVSFHRDVLEGLKEDDLLMQYDMLHPNEEGTPILAKKIGWKLRDMVLRIIGF